MKKDKIVISGDYLELISRDTNQNHKPKIFISLRRKLRAFTRSVNTHLLSNKVKYYSYESTLNSFDYTVTTIKNKYDIHLFLDLKHIYYSNTYKLRMFRNPEVYSISNIKNAKRNFRRLTETNYIKGISKFLTINTPYKDIDKANKFYKNFIKKLKRYLKKQNSEIALKYVTVPELHKDGKVHYHIIAFNLPEIEHNYLRNLNNNFNIYIRKIYFLNGLILYLVKQFKPTNPFDKLYYTSKNLNKPIIIEDNDVISKIRSTIIDKNNNLVYKACYNNNGSTISYQKHKISN